MVEIDYFNADMIGKQNFYGSGGLFVSLNFALGLIVFSGCSSTYFVDSAPTPAFTRPWQGNAQINFSTHKVFYFEGACSLPDNFMLLASHEPWTHDVSSDQRMTSLAAGRFWAGENMVGLYGGYGWGAHQFGLDYSTHNPFNEAPDSAHGVYKFQKFFIEAYYALLGHRVLRDSNLISSSYGVGLREEYVDKNSTSNISVTQVAAPLSSWGTDFIAFGSLGIPSAEFIQLYAQMLFRIQSKTGIELGDGVVLTAGIRVAF